MHNQAGGAVITSEIDVSVMADCSVTQNPFIQLCWFCHWGTTTVGLFLMGRGGNSNEDLSLAVKSDCVMLLLKHGITHDQPSHS